MEQAQGYIPAWASEGEGREGQGPPWILKISAKKGCFLDLEWEKTNFTTTFGPSLDKF